MTQKKVRPRCHNCKFRGEYFRLSDSGINHCHCLHPKYEEQFKSGVQVSPWDTLKEFWQTCDDHQFKEVEKPVLHQ